MRASRGAGFTLVELLVSLAILGILMAGFTYLFGNTLTVTRQVDVRNDILGDAQIAQNLMVSRLQEAWYVYPSATSLSLPSTGVGWQTANPVGGSNTFTVGSNLVAVIDPPQNVAANCTASPLFTDGCYHFYAYYPVLRSAYVTGTAGSFANRLLADTQNPNAWVLMQYDAFVTDGVIPPDLSGCVSTDDPPPITTGQILQCNASFFTSLTGSLFSARANLLADYLTPNVSPFTLTDLTTGNLPPAPDVQQVTVNPTFTRLYRGTTYAVGGSGSTLSTDVVGRNQKFPAN